MRPPVDEERVRAFARELARVAKGPVRLYLTGGATAVLEGWRDSTVDINVRMEPESDDLYRAIPRLKESLGINIELASPPDFVPELPRWRDRSPVVFTEGTIEVRNFDAYSQALSKIERGFAHDLEDVRNMLESDMIDPNRLLALYDQIESELFRYPAIDADAFRRKVEAVTKD